MVRAIVGGLLVTSLGVFLLPCSKTKGDTSEGGSATAPTPTPTPTPAAATATATTPATATATATATAIATATIDTSVKGAYAVGDKVNVEWKGKDYPATILQVTSSGSYKIHYDGYAASWDEVVTLARIHGKTGAAASSSSTSTKTVKACKTSKDCGSEKCCVAGNMASASCQASCKDTADDQLQYISGSPWPSCATAKAMGGSCQASGMKCCPLWTGEQRCLPDCKPQ
jgi:hypothetical protein